MIKRLITITLILSLLVCSVMATGATMKTSQQVLNLLYGTRNLTVDQILSGVYNTGGWGRTKTVVSGQSIQTRLNAAVAGDVVQVYAGTYSGNLTVPANVHLVGVDAFGVVVNGNILCLAGATARNVYLPADKTLTLNGIAPFTSTGQTADEILMIAQIQTFGYQTAPQVGTLMDGRGLTSTGLTGLMDAHIQPPMWRPISWRTWTYDAAGNGTVSNSVLNARWTPSDESHLSYGINVRVPVLQPAQQLKLVFGNYAGLYLNLSRFTLRVMVAATDAAQTTGSRTNVMPVQFNGCRDVTLDPGGLVESDPVPFAVTAGQLLWVRAVITVASTAKFVPGAFMQAADQVQYYNDTLTLDPATAATWVEPDSNAFGWTFATSAVATSFTNSLPTTYGPVTVLGNNGPTIWPSVALIGDSIMAYNSQFGSTSTFDATTYAGSIVHGAYTRPLKDASIPFVMLARPGEDMTAWLTLDTSRHRLLDHCTSAICEYGSNDIVAGKTTAQMKVLYLAVWNELADKGIKVYQVTVLPRTNTSNVAVSGFAAVGSVRTEVNAWLNDATASGAVAQSDGDLTGVIDCCPAVESTETPGTWSNYSTLTVDGVHPKPAGGTAIADYFAANYSIAELFAL